MRWRQWEELQDQLTKITWFSHAGESASIDAPHSRSVTSWNLAEEWAKSEISWWCVNEASNALRLYLSNNYRQEYRKWNEIIKDFTPSREKLLNDHVLPAVSPDVNQQVILDWVRSQLTRAYLEIAYSEVSEIHLVCDQIEWYLSGHFPCGWYVPNQESFPKDAITLIL